MCGIAGVYNASSEGVIKKMLSCVSHRGPDSEGLFSENGFDLGHRRLSIIDLSSSADQPMMSASGRMVIVFNGEIYNYREIALKYNLKLKTGSDTEVLLEAFEMKGTEILDELNGMFAAAIYDRVLKKLFLVRDRIGKKPLYYAFINDSFFFSSELKSFQKAGLKLTLNQKAVYLYLHLGYIPAPCSIYEEIKKLPQGTLLEFQDNSFQLLKWYDVARKVQKAVESNESSALRTLRTLVESAVKYRLISDVPFGTFLSGGVDSSLVSAVAARVSGGRINTFSIGFKESGFDERAYASSVARHINSYHHEYVVTYNDALHNLESVIDNFDEPFADSSALPVYLVSRMSRDKITMVLSGDGGDELFMGYGAYNWASRLNNPLVWLLGRSLLPFQSVLPERAKRVAEMFRNSENVQSRIFSQEQYLFSENEIGKILVHPNPASLTLDYGNIARKLSVKEKQAYFDLCYYLPDDLLVKTDRASMLNSMEVRCPLLDYRIVEFSLNLSEKLKVNRGVYKYLLRRLLYEYVPEHLFQRPKHGFSIPLKLWLQKELRYLLEENLSKEAVTKINILKFEQVNQLKNRFFNGEYFLYNRLWSLCILQRWLLKHAYETES